MAALQPGFGDLGVIQSLFMERNELTGTLPYAWHGMQVPSVSSARRLQCLECPVPSVSSARCLVSLVPGA